MLALLTIQGHAGDFQSPRHGRFDVCAAGEIGFDEGRLAALDGDFPDNVLPCLPVDVPDRDARSAAGKSARKRAAEAAAAPGHHHHIADLDSVARDAVFRHYFSRRFGWQCVVAGRRRTGSRVLAQIPGVLTLILYMLVRAAM